MQKPLRTLIIEDEQDSIDLMLNLILNYCPELISCGIAQNVKEGIEKIALLNPEVVLMDVSLGSEKSFDILEQLEQHNFILVFTTAYSDYAAKAFEHDAVYYMLKPYSISGMRKTVDKITDAKKLQLVKNANANKYSISSLGETIIIDIEDIIYIEASRAYSKMYLRDNISYVISKPLSQVEKDLGFHNFLRVDNSFIANLAQIIKLIKDKEYNIQMSNMAILPVSRNRRDDLTNRLNVK